MSVATLPVEFQDLPDGPGELSRADDGKVPVWSWEDRRLIMLPLPQPSDQRPTQIIVRGGGGGGGGEGGTSTLAGATDFVGVPGAGTDGYAIVWDEGAGAFTLAAAAGGGTPGGSTTQVQYNNAGAFAGDAGLTYDDANNALTVAGWITTGIVRPPSDSTTAVRVQSAAGSSTMLTVDTTNGRVGFGVTPSYRLHIGGASQNTVYYGLVTSLAAAGDIINYAALSNAVTGAISGFNYTVRATTGFNQLFQNSENANTNAHCRFEIVTSTANGGDPKFIYTISGVRNWCAGIDNSDSDRYKISASDSPGSLDRFYIETDGRAVFLTEDTGTNGIALSADMRRSSSGTPAAGFGAAIRVGLKSSTTANQDAGRLIWSWETATHASRASKGQLSAYYTATERPAITWGANSTVALLSFYDVTTPIACQVLATGAGATADDIITALQALGLVKQS